MIIYLLRSSWKTKHWRQRSRRNQNCLEVQKLPLPRYTKCNIQHPFFFFPEVGVYVIVLYMLYVIVIHNSGVKNVPRYLRKIIRRLSQNVRRSLSLLRHNISSTVTLEPCIQRSREFLFIKAAVAQFLWGKKHNKIMATLSLKKKTNRTQTKNTAIQTNAFKIFEPSYILLAPHQYMKTVHFHEIVDIAL